MAANRARKPRLLMLFGAAVAAAAGLRATLDRVVHPTADGANSLPPASAIVAAVVLLLILNFGVWLHLRWGDELERQHNFSAFAIGYLFNTSAYRAWLLPCGGGLVSKPDALILFVSTATVSFAAFCWMKLKAHIG